MIKSLRRVASVQLATLLMPVFFYALVWCCVAMVGIVIYWCKIGMEIFSVAGFIVSLASTAIISLIVSQLFKYGTKDIKFKEIMVNFVIFMSLAGFIFEIFC